MSKWRAEHPDYSRNNYAANREIYADYNRLWQLANPDRRSASVRKYYAAHPDRCLVRLLAWKARNPDRVKAYKSISGARRRAGTSGCSNKAISAIYNRCQELRQWFNVAVDHIIPLSKGGTHSISNLQIIYATENNRKHTSSNYKPKVIFK